MELILIGIVIIALSIVLGYYLIKKTRKTKGFSFEKNDLFLYENKPDSRDSDKNFHIPHENKKENKKRIVNDIYIPYHYGIDTGTPIEKSTFNSFGNGGSFGGGGASGSWDSDIDFDISSFID